MIFYTLEILLQPRIEFACSTIEIMTPESRNIIDHRSGMIEFGIHSNIDFRVESGTGTRVQHADRVGIYFPDEKYTISPIISKNAETQMNSVSVRIDHMRLERHSTSSVAEAARIIDDLPADSIALPETLSLSRDDTEVFISTMRSLISTRLEHTAAGRLRCLSLWYELAAQTDSAFRSGIYSQLEKSGDIPSSSYYHVYRIRHYVTDHISEDLSVTRIASAIGLSPDYAGRIFRRECGISLTEHILRTRVSLLRSLISSESSSPLSELTARVGFKDLRYAQRVFKQKTGCTMHRCRQLDTGITLWHNDPWQTPDLETDIYRQGSAHGADSQ